MCSRSSSSQCFYRISNLGNFFKVTRKKKWSPFQWTCKLTFRVYLKSTRVISGKFHKMSQSSNFSGHLGVTTLACFSHNNLVYLNFSKKRVCFALVINCETFFILSRDTFFFVFLSDVNQSHDQVDDVFYCHFLSRCLIGVRLSFTPY